MPRRDPAQQMFLDLAGAHGFRDEVEALLKGRHGPPPEPLHELLETHRAATGLTLEDVHRRSNISRSRINQIEHGQSNRVGLRTLQALAYGYKLPFTRVLLAAWHSTD